ncbi:hypothetical protein N7456_000805 [Penicillium angulare]|uniref:Btz domain-containing protein n=1 Tax=Penicillium angulare TaxID=116970 RepID=A0A9W9GCW1_9EURO|nr:hypothetical protein N7456_000805 [Penicillium angulare]
MAPLRRHIGASRRKRRDDDGEDESSLAGDLEDDSLSEGSIDTHQDDEDADVEGSETEDEVPTTKTTNDGETDDREARNSSTSTGKPELKSTVSDTEAMLDGLKVSDDMVEIQPGQVNQVKGLQAGRTPSAPPTEPKREALAARKRRDHDKYTKERDQNPAFVPTRGSFFLHDKRTTEMGSNNHRASNKGKSRPYGLIVDGNTRRDSKGDVNEGLWAHDLHATVAGDDPPAPKQPAPSTAPQTTTTVPTAPRSSPPNRTFSSTTLVGNVPVIVFLPGMSHPTSFAAVPKKQHTRLPQHRPPLRRDKPVRISLPNQNPRYIFPSTDRSFIFIPRALRPNQGWRGRGRGGMYPPRRPSYFPGAYPPSLPPSRRTSLGMSSQDGYPSPAGSVYARPIMLPPDASKPVVRLPPPPRPMGFPPGPGIHMGLPGPMQHMPPPMPLHQHPPYRESRPAPIPMYQPRPKKTVSVADIEGPESFPFNPPQPQQEQPFHHQVPVPVPISGSGQDGGAHGPPSQPSATPLSQIPERAIHAPSFQPTYGTPGYYQPYPPGAMYYPGHDYSAYSGPMGPGASVPNFPPGQQPLPYQQMPGSSLGEQSSQPEMVAHESGGTVYFYNPNQMYSNNNYGQSGTGPGGVVGIGGMITPPGTSYYYPQPPGPGNVYYGAQ